MSLPSLGSSLFFEFAGGQSKSSYRSNAYITKEDQRTLMLSSAQLPYIPTHSNTGAEVQSLHKAMSIATPFCPNYL